MTERQWTGSVSVLPESMRGLAMEFFEKACAAAETKYEDRGDVERALNELAGYLRDHASTLSEWSNAVEQLYAPIAAPATNADEEVPTNAQGIALARFLRPQFRDSVHPGLRSAQVFRGGLGLPDDYVVVRLAEGYEGGIDRDGRTST